MPRWMLLAFIGSVSGFVMGFAGVGGGVVILLGLLFLAHMPQKLAQGTTLLVAAAPLSLLAAYRYHKSGFVDVRAALVIMAAFLVFSLLGAELAVWAPRRVLRIGLGAVLVLMGARLLVSP